MSVQMQQFRVVGVNRGSGADVSVVIDAATKAAAEVKAEQMNIETTHIVRLKQQEPTPPSEHELFSAEAAEALAGKRTDKLIEEVVPPEEPRAITPTPVPVPVIPDPPKSKRRQAPEPPAVVAAITRPTYAAHTNKREAAGDAASGINAFGLILLVLLAITAGAYFVLVHEPNAVEAEQHELVFGEHLFSDVTAENPSGADIDLPDAFNKRTSPPGSSQPPIAKDRQINLTNTADNTDKQATPKPAATNTPRPVKLELQSVVTSHEGRFAVINGKLYKQGATVAGHKLLNVADDWVLVEKDGKQNVIQIRSDQPK